MKIIELIMDWNLKKNLIRMTTNLACRWLVLLCSVIGYALRHIDTIVIFKVKAER